MMQERILLLMKSFAMNPTEFADEIGVQRSSISHILSGRNNPSLDLVTKILNRFPEIDSNWLVLGKGSLVVKSEDKSSQDVNNETSKPSESLFDEVNDDLFTDSQKSNLLKLEKDKVEDLQRKIEILEGKSAIIENMPAVNERIPVSKDNAISNSKEIINDEMKSSVIPNQKEDDNSEISNHIISNELSIKKNDSNKHIKKLIIFYSDNSYEELIKN